MRRMSVRLLIGNAEAASECHASVPVPHAQIRLGAQQVTGQTTKTLLLASSALVMTAGVAAADISLSGSANMGLSYDGTDTTVSNEIDFGINASATTDSGIEFGASIDLDAAWAKSASDQDSGDSFDPEVYISAGGLTLTVGAVDPATDPFGIGDIGFLGLGVDDIGEKMAGFGVKGDADVLVEYTMGDYSFAASTDTSGTDFALAVFGTVGDLSFGIGYNEADLGMPASLELTWVDLSYTSGAYTVGAFYAHGLAPWSGATTDDYGLEGSYAAGDLTISVAYAYDDLSGTDAYGIGAAYDLGSGLGVAGGVAEVAGTTVADFGVTMSF